MKKNILIKSILVLVAIAIFALVFVGCASTPTPTPTTGTVIISIANDTYYYNIYIDGVWWGETNWSGELTLYNVPTGYHTFYAVAIDFLYNGYVYQTIYTGTNYVTFWVY